MFKVNNNKNTKNMVLIMFKVNNKDIRTTIKASEQRQWRFSGVFIFNFEHI